MKKKVYKKYSEKGEEKRKRKKKNRKLGRGRDWGREEKETAGSRKPRSIFIRGVRREARQPHIVCTPYANVAAVTVTTVACVRVIAKRGEQKKEKKGSRNSQARLAGFEFASNATWRIRDIDRGPMLISLDDDVIVDAPIEARSIRELVL